MYHRGGSGIVHQLPTDLEFSASPSAPLYSRSGNFFVHTMGGEVIDPQPVSFDFIGGRLLENLGFEKQHDDLDPIAMPWNAWNRNCHEQGGRKGLGRSWIVMLGGLPGEGKTTAMTNIMAAAVRDGRRVATINVEMSTEGLASRYMSCLTGVPMHLLERGSRFDAAAWQRATEIVNEQEGELWATPPQLIRADDIPGIYAHLASKGVDLVVVDYAQMIAPGASTDSIFLQTKEVSRALTYSNLEHQLTTVVGSQLVDRYKGQKPRAPGKMDAVGGMIWTHDMNQMVFIDHSSRQDKPNAGKRYVDLICRKNRHGPENWRVKLEVDFETFRMRERSY